MTWPLRRAGHRSLPYVYVAIGTILHIALPFPAREGSQGVRSESGRWAKASPGSVQPPLPGRALGRLAQHPNEAVEHFLVHRSEHLVANRFQGRERGECRTIGPLAGQRVVDVDHRDQSRSLGDLRARQTTRIPGAVEPLVVLEHGRAHVRRQSLALLAEHFQPHLRMLHHRLPLVGVQGAGFVQNQIRDSGLSDVVKEGAHPERSELVAIVSTVVRERGAIDADVHGMSVDGVVVHRLYQTRDAARRSRDLAGDLTYDAHRHFDVLWGSWREEDELSRRYGRVVHQGRFHIDREFIIR